MDTEKHETHEVNGWHEWSKFVLKELERLNYNYNELNSYIQQMTNRLNQLPCAEQQEKMKSTDIQIGWLQKIIWTICIIGIPALIGLAVAWGAIVTTVTRNTGKIERFEAHMVLSETELTHLKGEIQSLEQAVFPKQIVKTKDSTLKTQ